MKKGLLLFILIAVFACNQKPGAPDDLLPRDKMEDILWDLMRADLFINNYMVIKDTALDKKKQGIELYTQILKLHKVSQKQFRESFLYYRSQTDELKVIMDSLSRHTDADTAKLQKPAKMEDSTVKTPDTPPVKPDTTRRSSIPRQKAE